MKRKTVEIGVGGFLRAAPLNIYSEWKGLGMQCPNDFVRKNSNVHDLVLLKLNAQELHCDEVGQPADGVAKEGDTS